MDSSGDTIAKNTAPLSARRRAMGCGPGKRAENRGGQVIGGTKRRSMGGQGGGSGPQHQIMRESACAGVRLGGGRNIPTEQKRWRRDTTEAQRGWCSASSTGQSRLRIGRIGTGKTPILRPSGKPAAGRAEWALKEAILGPSSAKYARNLAGCAPTACAGLGPGRLRPTTWWRYRAEVATASPTSCRLAGVATPRRALAA